MIYSMSTHIPAPQWLDAEEQHDLA